MYTLILLSTFATLLQCVIAGELTRNIHESPFGLTFTPSAVLASRYNVSGLVEVTRYPVNSKYQTYYDEAVHGHGLRKERRRDDHDESAPHLAAVALFRHIVDPITTDLNEQLEYEPTYATLFMPSVFHDDIIAAAGEAVFGRTSLERPIKYGPSHGATCHAYDFLGCKHLNRAPGECNWDGPENLVLLLEYEKDYLYAFLKAVGFHLGTYSVTAQEICKGCGERFREAS